MKWQGVWTCFFLILIISTKCFTVKRDEQLMDKLTAPSKSGLRSSNPSECHCEPGEVWSRRQQKCVRRRNKIRSALARSCCNPGI